MYVFMYVYVYRVFHDFRA